jgi:hypothetical protein
MAKAFSQISVADTELAEHNVDPIELQEQRLLDQQVPEPTEGGDTTSAFTFEMMPSDLALQEAAADDLLFF